MQRGEMEGGEGGVRKLKGGGGGGEIRVEEVLSGGDW